MSKRTHLTVNELKEKIITLGGESPKKGSGSGENGNVVKKDLINVYEELKTKKDIGVSPKLKEKIMPKENVTKLLYTDIWEKIVRKLEIEDIINLCAANENLESKICDNHNYWISRLKKDFNIPNEYVKVDWLEKKLKLKLKLDLKSKK